jgi:DNA-binding MarR family transcriptional regulator
VDISIIDISMKTTSDLKLLEKYGRLRRGLNLLATQVLRPLGMGPKQAAFLRHLSRQGKASLADLSKATLTDPAAAGRLVKVLQNRGVIERRDHPTDQRSWEVKLTSQGVRMVKEVEKAYEQLAERAVRPLSAAEKKEFSNILDKLLGAMGMLKTPAKGGSANPEEN